MLEWYRPTTICPFQAMVSEIQDLVETQTEYGRPEVIAYSDVFEATYGLNPHQAMTDDLVRLSSDLLGSKAAASLDLDSQLNVLFATEIEPHLTNHIVINFPMIQSALARIERDGEDSVAKRAELYIAGREIANGYHELTDAVEQAARFEEDNRRRESLHRAVVPRDDALLDALTSGLPESYGVALGVDRLLQVMTQSKTLSECMTFTGHL